MLLSALLLVPLLVAGTIPCLEKPRQVAAIGSLLILALSVALFGYFDPSLGGLQFVEVYRWLDVGGMQAWFKLGVDGLSMPMVLLTGILLPCAIAASGEPDRPKLYYSLLFVLVAAVLGVFMAQDLILFFVFWELELLPMYLLIANWGGKDRIRAANKFLIYTFLAGGLVLMGLVLLYWLGGRVSFDMLELANALSTENLVLLHICFLLLSLGFAIKLPSIPLHTWLPAAHVEAPTPISMLLAGILLKMGAYGLLRFGTLYFVDSIAVFGVWLAALGALNVVLGAVFALAQDDMKRVVAYSSISHMGFILIGFAIGNAAALTGAMFQMFSHGLISAGLFMLVGVIYERAHTRHISDFGGLAKPMPKLFFAYLGLAMANLGLPALSGFVGESLVFYGAFTSAAAPAATLWWVALAVIGIILTAGYMLLMGRRVFFGSLPHRWQGISDVSAGELRVLGGLFGLSLLLGVYPKLLSDILQTIGAS